jgi:hypothetical protein
MSIQAGEKGNTAHQAKEALISPVVGCPSDEKHRSAAAPVWHFLSLCRRASPQGLGSNLSLSSRESQEEHGDCHKGIQHPAR